MDTLIGLFSLFALFLVARGYDEHGPMVAFMCNRPAMYLTDAGWAKDDSSDCMKDPVDILNYCRKVYPKEDVRNVVESSKKVTVGKWCGFGHNKCHHEFTVRPFRCLVGTFQSDALLVPEHCLFDHIHNSKDCKTYDDWNKTAVQSCQDRGMVQQDFAILRPCGIDRFSGVEFVCCPEEDEIDQFLRKEFEYYSTTPVATTTDAKTTTPLPTTTTPKVQDYDLHDDIIIANSANDIYNKYLHNMAGQYINEHEYFMKAKGDLEKHHHEKVTKMMKEWAEARQHVQDLKSVDAKGADKLNKEITARFEKTYQALEQEGMAEKKQLVALHQQRVQAGLNDKKRHAMDRYTNILTDDNADAAMILKSLEHYIKAEQKDRLHSIGHYKHLKETDPAEAEAVRDQTLNHLDLIQARIQQAVDMLNRVPKYEKKIRQQIEDYLATFQPLDSSMSKLLVEAKTPEEETFNPADVVKEYQQQQKQQQQQQEKEQQSPKQDDKPDIVAVPVPELPKVIPTKPKAEPTTTKPTPTPAPAKKEYYDDEVEEDEHDYVLEKQEGHVAHLQQSSFQVNSYIKEEPMNTARSFSTPTLAIAIGSVTVFIVIVVGIIVLRQRAHRAANSRGFVEVDQSASPEEKHVTNMQLNGYENPTYKYFEMNGNSA